MGSACAGSSAGLGRLALHGVQFAARRVLPPFHVRTLLRKSVQRVVRVRASCMRLGAARVPVLVISRLVCGSAREEVMETRRCEVSVGSHPP